MGETTSKCNNSVVDSVDTTRVGTQNLNSSTDQTEIDGTNQSKNQTDVGLSNSNFQSKIDITNQTTTSENESEVVGNYSKSLEKEDDEDCGKLIEIPFLSNQAFDFEEFVSPNALTRSECDNDKWILVTDTHIPSVGSVTNAHAEARCQFLGIECSDSNLSEQKDILILHLKRFKQVSSDFCEKFFVKLSAHLGIYYDERKEVECWSHVTTAFNQCETTEDVEKFLVLVYLSFDFIDNYRQKLTNAVLHQLGIKVIKPMYSKKAANKPRKRISCFERITTVIINSFRKSINRLGPDTCGWTITNSRPGYVIDETADDDYREPKTMYKWMICGKKVKILCLSLQLLTNFL